MKLSLKSPKTFKYGDRLNPGRDWLVLLTIFLIALVISLGYNFWTFSKITRGQKIGDSAVSTPAQIKLDQVKSLFESRAAERERYGSDRFVDPSI